MNSWRLSSQICPVAVRNWIAAIHSSMRRLDLADDRVKVGDHRRHDLLEAGILGTGHALDHGGGGGVLVEVAHRSSGIGE